MILVAVILLLTGYTVSPSNDPYFYRYWQARLLERSGGLTDVSMFAEVGELTRVRPLTLLKKETGIG